MQNVLVSLLGVITFDRRMCSSLSESKNGTGSTKPIAMRCLCFSHFSRGLPLCIVSHPCILIFATIHVRRVPASSRPRATCTHASLGGVDAHVPLSSTCPMGLDHEFGSDRVNHTSPNLPNPRTNRRVRKFAPFRSPSTPANEDLSTRRSSRSREEKWEGRRGRGRGRDAKACPCSTEHAWPPGSERMGSCTSCAAVVPLERTRCRRWWCSWPT